MEMQCELLNELERRYAVVKRSGVRDCLCERMESYLDEVRERSAETCPVCFHEELYERSKGVFDMGNATFEALESDFYDGYMRLQGFVNVSADADYWKKQVGRLRMLRIADKLPSFDLKKEQKKLGDDMDTLHKLLLQKWGEVLERAKVEWELEQLRKAREALLKDLSGWLNMLQAFQDVMDDLSFDPGILFDLSAGILTETDVAQLQQWYAYIKDNESVRALCDMLGKLRSVTKSVHQERVMRTVEYERMVLSCDSREEIVGLGMGNDVANALPQEFALLRDEDTEVLFDKKFVESQLLCFDMEGYDVERYELDEEEWVGVDEEDEMGPMIVCVDTSGSMSGIPESVAKAIVLSLASRSVKQGRDCYLINFSTSIETMQFSKGMVLRELLDFLKKSFHGGTDVYPAIEHASSMMRRQQWAKADLLIVSDFVMPDFSSSLVGAIESIRANDNKIYSLSIGDLFLSDRHAYFDDEWVFDPRTSNVRKLCEIMRVMR